MAEEFLEELIVRRELAFNFARFAGNLESLDACRSGASEPWRSTRKDAAPALYTPEQFETRRDLRCALERHAERTAAARQNSRLLPDVLGQEDHRMVAHL